MTNLSPAAQAVFDASRKYATQAWNHGTRQRFNLSIVAALRAAAEQLGENSAPGAEFEDLYPRIIEVPDLLAIAAELEDVNEL